MCKVLRVSKSGYYAWIKAKKSATEEENQALEKDILFIYEKSRRVFGWKKIRKAILKMPLKDRKFKGSTINHKRIQRLMKKLGIQSKVCKKYKATTNSNHSLPVAENLLNREFKTERPNEKLVSDITYIATEEGWLYVAAINDLYGHYNIGLSMSTRMTKQLVIAALDDAYRRGGKPCNTILHSDRGSQYCSYAYQERLKKYGYTCSMSRKGNCWDNAPIESFWGKMKMEWLNDCRFKTIEEAKSKVFEYVMIFYNRQRIHESNDYITPEEYYHSYQKSKSKSTTLAG